MMLKIKVYRDLEAAERFWKRNWPQRCFFDLWAVRDCFQTHFNRSPYFLVAEENNRFRGMVALSWIDEEQCFGHFPGEVWQGKTWLEQNKILAGDSEVLDVLLNHIPNPAKIRYLTIEPCFRDGLNAVIDETGFLFLPKQHGYSFEDYLQSFSGKSRKKIRAEINRLEKSGLSYRHDRLSDIEHMFRMNIEAFKENSYFSDSRFLKSFEALSKWLHANGMLRVTTVLIGGEVAAVDMGAIFGSTHTVLAGGTNAAFPGVAKLINFHHVEWACRQRLSAVDFLCGDFKWKNRFHLAARPLYKISNPQTQEAWQDDVISSRDSACAA